MLTLLAVAASLVLQSPAQELTGTERTKHFEIRFRPGSRAEASVDRVLALVEKELAMILEELGLRTFPHTIQLFLYDDVADLQKTTGVPSGGHSIPLESHVPHDNDQTRVHELVHVVAEKFVEKGDEERNLFFAEGLSNAVLRFVHGVHVDAVAAFYKQRGELPALAEMAEAPDFYAWLGKHPGFNGYDVAGSYMRYLLDTFGAAKVRMYYRGVSAKKAFGKDLAALEKGWHARLDKVKLRPGLVALLEGRNPERPKLEEPVPGPATAWRELRPGKVIEVSGEKNEGDWSVVQVLEDELGDAVVRCKAEALKGCYGVKIQLGIACQAIILRGQGTFLYSDIGGVGHSRNVELGDDPVEIVLRREKGRASVWIDGVLVAAASIAMTPAPLAIGCVGGPARFTQIAMLRP